MKHSVEDLVGEIQENLRARSTGRAMLSWSLVALDPPRFGVRVAAIDARGTNPPQSAGVTVEVSADSSSLAAEYFGVQVSAGPWPIPKDDTGEFALSPDGELLEICERIFEPLSHF
jgi:hypothetical protein